MNGVNVHLTVGLIQDSYGSKTPSEDALHTGFIDEGRASGPTGSKARYDASFGTSYGDGQRYAREEAYGTVLVPSRHK